MGSVGANKNTVSSLDVYNAVVFADKMQGSFVDEANKIINIPFGPRTKEKDVSGPLGTATYFRNQGFNVTFETRDVEYKSKTRGSIRRGFDEGGRIRYLRNRLVMTLRW